MNINADFTEPETSTLKGPARELPEGESATVRRVLRLSSQALLDGAHEVEIEHHGALYRLRQTSLGKLILTK